MLVYGAYQLLAGGSLPVLEAAPQATPNLTLALVLSTFSAGCTALTGIEAISNGRAGFQIPESNNAGETLIIMTGLMAVLFIGSIGLTQYLGVIAGADETILSALARRILGSGFLYYLVSDQHDVDPDGGGQHQFAGFRQVGRHPGQGWFPAASIHRAGRPSGFCQWHRSAGSCHWLIDRPVRRRRPPADPTCLQSASSSPIPCRRWAWSGIGGGKGAGLVDRRPASTVSVPW